MEIILIRHGQPISAKNETLNSTGFAYWVKRYHHADIAPESRPAWRPDEAMEAAYLVSSDLKRAKDSSKIIFDKLPQHSYPCLREMDIPRYKLPFTLRAWSWVYLNRFLWMLGKKGKFESYSEAKKRAIVAADLLVDLAQEHSRVVSVGHGFMNLHILRYLQKQGWSITEKNNAFWGVSRLQSAT